MGIPCGIGIRANTTLAKLANHIAKTAEREPGSYPEKLIQVCNLSALPQEELDEILAATPKGEVLRIGRRISTQLIQGGVMTLQDLVGVLVPTRF